MSWEQATVQKYTCERNIKGELKFQHKRSMHLLILNREYIMQKPCYNRDVSKWMHLLYLVTETVCYDVYR